MEGEAMSTKRRSMAVGRSVVRQICAVAVAIFWFFPGEARAEYRLNPGDVLEISVTGIPDLRQRATVDVGGAVMFPLVGRVDVGGLTLSELRDRVPSLLAAKVYRQRSDDGRENMFLIAPEEVSINIAEYRPVYVSGDVAKPGEQTFRPGLTVRQAVALAGGYDIMRFRMNNPFLEAADLRSEHDALWTEFSKEQVRIWRLEAELQGKPRLGSTELPNVPIAPQIVSRIVDVERELLNVRLADLQKEKQHLQRSMTQADSQLASLVEQKTREEEGARADAADFEKVQELFQRGSAPMTRLMDARRTVLLSSTRLLQTVVQIGQVTRDREKLSRDEQKVDDVRRADLLRDLQEANLRLATIRSRLQAVSEKLLYTGTVKSQLVRGTGGKPDVLIFRKGADDRIVASEDTELLPGDVVEIALRAEFDLGTPTR